MPRKSTEKKIIKKKNDINDIEKLLNQQTVVILDAVDEKLQRTEAKMEQMMDEKLQRTEARLNQKLDRLVNNIDKFLKRLIDMEDEMQIIKFDINRIKEVVKEKLGVNLM